jgi:hypothetical protein
MRAIKIAKEAEAERETTDRDRKQHGKDIQ